MTLRAVFFDFGGTLARADPTIDTPWKGWAKVAQELHLGLTEAEIRRVNHEADQRFEGQIYGYHGRTREFWRMRDMWAIERLGVKSQQRRYWDALQDFFENPDLVRLYPETREVLANVRAIGLHVGIISNYTDALVPRLKHLGLLPFFDSVTYSQAVGAEKPDPRMFSRAIKPASCRPHEALHVGDSWEGDYLGATRAGLRAAWLNRKGLPRPGACDEIRDLRGLLPLLRRSDERRAVHTLDSLHPESPKGHRNREDPNPQDIVRPRTPKARVSNRLPPS